MKAENFSPKAVHGYEDDIPPTKGVHYQPNSDGGGRTSLRLHHYPEYTLHGRYIEPHSQVEITAHRVAPGQANTSSRTGRWRTIGQDYHQCKSYPAVEWLGLLVF